LFNQDIGGPVKVVAPADFTSVGMDPSAVEGAKAFKAFRLGPMGQRDPEIYVNSDSPEYKIGKDKNLESLSALALAGAFSHEMTHDKEQNEYPAYRLEADLLLSKLASLPPHLQAAGKQYWQAVERMAQEEHQKERMLRKK
jgi:hypothetical protein